MAEHFEEIIDLRLRQLETRVEGELMAVAKHFQELQTFWTESLNSAVAGLEARLGGRIDALDGRMDTLHGRMDALDGRMGALDGRMDALDGRMDALDGRMDALDGRMDALDGRMGRLERRLDNFQDANRLEHERFKDKMDAHHEATLLVLKDILRRLPPPSTT